MNKYGLIILGSLLILGSCRDKDEPANGNNSKIQGNGVFKTDNGDRVVCSEIGDVEMYYNDKGLPIRVGDYIFDYDDMVFYPINDDVKYKFTLNGSGCITSISFRYNDSDGDVETENWSLTYDGSSHLTECKYSFTEVWNDEGVKHTDTYTEVTNITWVNNKITKVQQNSKDYCDKRKHLDEETSTCIPVYYEQNRLGQFTQSFSKLVDIEDIEEFILSGLFGEAPAYLPSKVAWTYIYKCSEDNESERGYYTYDYDYAFNGNRTIEREYYTYVDDEGYKYDGSYYYSYMPFGTRAGSIFGTTDESKTSIAGEPRKTRHKSHIKEKIECRKKQKTGSI